jgi:tRNA uridine 5-carbamoylmethylation protein Kti12
MMSQENQNNHTPPHFIISNGAMTLPHVVAFIVTVLAGAAVFFSLQSDVRVLDQRVTNVEKIIDQRITSLEKVVADQGKDINNIERNTNQISIQIAQVHEKIMKSNEK